MYRLIGAKGQRSTVIDNNHLYFMHGKNHDIRVTCNLSYFLLLTFLLTCQHSSTHWSSVFL